MHLLVSESPKMAVTFEETGNCCVRVVVERISEDWIARNCMVNFCGRIF